MYVVHKKYEKLNISQKFYELGQLICLENGIINIQIEDKIIMLPPWYCVWIPPGFNCSFWSNQPEILTRTIFFESNLCENAFFKKPAVFNVRPIVREMVRYTEKWNGLTDMDIYKEKFISTLRQILPGEMEKSILIYLPSTKDTHLQNILDYILSKLSENLTLNEICKKHSVSERTIQRLLKNNIGVSFSTYLKHARILKAIELLSNSELTVSEIAYNVGYESVQTFSNTFYMITGERPKKYKKNRDV